MLVIFDWDGTLSDSERYIVQAMRAAASDCGLAVPSESSVRHIIGLGLAEAVAELFPDSRDAQRDAVVKAYSAHYVNNDEGMPPLFPSAREVLDALLANGHRIAVATGKSRRGLNRILDHLSMQHLFHATRCADETRSKPHPQMLFELLEALSFQPEQAVMVGDTSYDLEMASNAGMASIGVSYGVHPVETLQSFKPLAVIDDLNDLLDHIR